MREIEVRPYRPGDEAGILHSFNIVFREVCGASFVDRDMAFWRWQFLDNPHGIRIWVAEAPDGTIAAHYGGVPLAMDTVFGPRMFVQSVDSFVHPDYRQGLKRPGIFVLTGARWFDACEHIHHDAVPYGLPVPTAERIGQRYLAYKRLRVVDYLCRDLADADAAPMPSAVEVRRVDELPADVDRLYARVAPEHRCWTRRDRAYLEHRYLRCPGIAYELHAARRNGELVGLMVLRPQHELVPDACTIADWIVPLADAEAMDALVAAAVARGRAHGRRTLLTVFADPAPEHAAFRQRGFVITPSANTMERRIAHHAYDPQMPTEWLIEHWWYTLGDTDLV